MTSFKNVCGVVPLIFVMVAFKEVNALSDRQRENEEDHHSRSLKSLTGTVTPPPECPPCESAVPSNSAYGEENFRPEEPIRILTWTKQWGKAGGPWYPEGTKAFEQCKFYPSMKCTYTHDRSQYNVSDAVVFHSFYIKDMPLSRDPHQKWVFWENESPRIVTILQNLHIYKHEFNLTSTYMMNSDVPLPMLKKCIPGPGQLNVRAARDESFAAGKDRLVAWFVNHCNTPSRREIYVKELQNHIDVDIYGACGPYKCSAKDSAYCYKNVVEKRYKFILIFESSLCQDYISDQLWDIFDHRVKVIPIVLGAADYSTLLPKGTYIDVRDYHSPSHLAVYLKYLDRHDDKYNDFIWRRKFDTCSYLTPHPQYQCGLCEHLHRYRGVSEIALNVATYWSIKRRCIPPQMFYQKVAKEVIGFTNYKIDVFDL